jgi:ABC-2 type transport system permease protein
LAFASPWAGLCAAFFGGGAVASAALVNLWRQAPSRRSLVLRRHSQSKLVGLMEHLVSILWAVATAIAVIGSSTVVVPLAAIAPVLAINRKWAAMEAAARG